MSWLIRRRCELLVLGFALYQFVLWSWYASSTIARAPALGFDQVSYLTQVYGAFLGAQQEGFRAGLSELLSHPHAAGNALQFQAFWTLLATGLGRRGALTINILYFVLLPVILFFVFGRRQGISFYLILCGFLMSINSMYALLGGPMDFRLDFAAMVIFAILCALAWRSRWFTDRRLCVLIGLTAAWLCWTRSLMVVQLGTILVLLSATVTVVAIRCPTLIDNRGIGQELSPIGGLVLSATVAAAGILPYLYVMREQLWGYYVVGHLTGAEPAVRASVMGLSGPTDSLLYYVRAIYRDQLGRSGSILVLMVVGAAVSALVAWLQIRRGRPAQSKDSLAAIIDPGSAIWGAVVVIVSLVGPYAVLTAGLQKSHVVANVLLPGVGGILLLCHALLRATLPGVVGKGRARRLILGLAVVAFGYGATHQIREVTRPPFAADQREAFVERERMIGAITAATESRRWSAPLLFVDHIGNNDALQLDLTSLERFGRHLGLVPVLAQIFEVEPSVLWPTLSRTHFLLLRRDPVETSLTGYPYDHHMTALHSDLWAFCRDHCDQLGDFDYLGLRLTLFANRNL